MKTCDTADCKSALRRRDEVAQICNLLYRRFAIGRAPRAFKHARAAVPRRVRPKTQDRSVSALAPFQVQGIGAVCNIPWLPARLTAVIDGPKALPGDLGGVPPRCPKRDSTVVPR